jgi:hypothetical protein
VGSFKGLTKGQRQEINELVDFTFQSDPHTLGNRFEAVDSGGLGGNYLNKYFRLTLMSQVTDGAKIQHNSLISCLCPFVKPLNEPTIAFFMPCV